MTGTSRSVDAGRLKTLAEKANEAHRQAQSAARQEIQHAIEAGKLLLKAKEAVGHGNFTKWVEENFEGSSRQATRYMRLAKAADQNRIDPDEVSSLTEAENMLRDQDAEPTREEYEPEVEGEEYDFSSQEEYDKFFGEGAAAAAATKEAAPREPEKKPERQRDLLQAAFNAIHRALEEVEGEERAERIQAIIDRAKVYETTEVEPRRSRKRETKPVQELAREAAPEETAPKFQCPSCESLWDEEDLITVRECSNEQCGAIFDGDSGRNCEECNRPFTRRLHDRGCPDCADEMPCDLDVLEEEESSPAEKWDAFVAFGDMAREELAS